MRHFEGKEITKLLDALIGEVEAIGESNEDERRFDNLKVLIEVTDWCLDGLMFAMASGIGRPEWSMRKIGQTAQGTLDEIGELIKNWRSEYMERADDD